jgi:EmrB/QacA subfamily drug resistance transporter
MSWSVINTALPTIKIALGASLLQLQWMMSVFGLAIVTSLVIMGRLADVYGKKRFYLLGLTSLSLSLIGSSLSPSPGWIIFFLTFSGLAGAIILPVSQSLLCWIYPESQRGKALGMWASSNGIGLALGPLISGVVLEFLGWRWVFWVLLAVALLSLIIVTLFVQETEKVGDERIDWLGAGFLSGAIGAFVIAVNQSKTWPLSLTLGFFLLSAIFLALLLWYEKKPKFPIIREDLLKNRSFLLASIAIFSLIFFVWASFFLLPLYFQTIQKFTPLQTGLTMLFVTIPLALVSPYVGTLADRFGPKNLMALGSLFLLISVILQMRTFNLSTSYFSIALATTCFGLGWAFLWGPSTSVALSKVPTRTLGLASGTFVTFQEIGGTLGLAITVTVVRMEGEFLKGLHGGHLVLIATTLAGLIASLLIKREIPQRD